MKVEFCYKKQYYDTVEGKDLGECEEIFMKRHPGAQEITVREEGSDR